VVLAQRRALVAAGVERVIDAGAFTPHLIVNDRVSRTRDLEVYVLACQLVCLDEDRDGDVGGDSCHGVTALGCDCRDGGGLVIALSITAAGRGLIAPRSRRN
jgi:hypothetical protein